jgi:hypothetical protein
MAEIHERRQLDLGESVDCIDGNFGVLADMVVDPSAEKLTHLVVKPRHGDGISRLVPFALTGPGNDEHGGVVLRCTIAALSEFVSVEDYAYLRIGELPLSADPEWDVGIARVLAMPYYGGEGVEYGGVNTPDGLIFDRVPKGEVEIRRESIVSAADGGYLGHVAGLILLADRITHVVLRQGHFWARRQVSIAIGDIHKVETDAVTVRLSKKAVAKLHSTRVKSWF